MVAGGCNEEEGGGCTLGFGLFDAAGLDGNCSGGG